MTSFISSFDLKYIFFSLSLYFFIGNQSSFPIHLSSIPSGGAERTVQCTRASTESPREALNKDYLVR